MKPSATRIWAMVLRYSALHRRSLLRTFDVFFWPVLDLLVWGFVTSYLQRQLPGLASGASGLASGAGGPPYGGGPVGAGVSFLIGGMILWDLHYRAQQGMTISLMEEIWTRNIVNLLVTPLRRWEWLVATILYGLAKVVVIALVLGGLAFGLYAFRLWAVGWGLAPLLVHLLIFAWAVGLVTAGFVIRFGYAAEALIWGIPFLIQPFSAVFYPVAVLPAALRPIALALPTTYVFEDLRAALAGDLTVGWAHALPLVALNGAYVALGIVVFSICFRQAARSGRLGRLGQD